MNVKVLKDFKDTHTKELYTAGAEIEMSEERFAEAEANLAKYGGGYIEAIVDEPGDQGGGDAPPAEPSADAEAEANPEPAKPAPKGKKKE